MSASAPRTTAGLLGDLLASIPEQRLVVAMLADRVQRDRAGVDRAITLLSKAGAIQNEPHPGTANTPGRRPNAPYMTLDQAQAWKKDDGAAIAAAAGIALEVAPVVSKAAAALVKARATRQDARLRFAVWSDGAIAIEGLGRKQLTLDAAATGSLASTLASLPEGALQSLLESALKPVFTLHVEGRDYPLSTEQTADLVAYIEQLPAKALRTPQVPGFRAGSDHRVHRIETPSDRDGEEAR